METLAKYLGQRRDIDLSECFIDGTFTVAKKGGVCGKNERSKVTKLIVVTDVHRFSICLYMAAASPPEVTFVETTLIETFISGRPT